MYDLSPVISTAIVFIPIGFVLIKFARCDEDAVGELLSRIEVSRGVVDVPDPKTGVVEDISRLLLESDRDELARLVEHLLVEPVSMVRGMRFVCKPQAMANLAILQEAFKAHELRMRRLADVLGLLAEIAQRSQFSVPIGAARCDSCCEFIIALSGSDAVACKYLYLIVNSDSAPKKAIGSARNALVSLVARSV